MKVALIMLAGQGDHDTFFLPVEVVEWAKTLQPGEVTIPQNIFQALEPMRDHEMDTDFWSDEIDVSTGSGFNDVLLHFSTYVIHCDLIREVSEFAKERGWEIVDEIDGYIY